MADSRDPLAEFTGGVFTRKQAREHGVSDRQLTRRMASGRLLAVRRGVLIDAATGKPALHAANEPHAPAGLAGLHAPAGLAALDGSGAIALPPEVHAALLASPSRDLVVSHASAARLLGLPQPLGGWPRPEFTATTGSNRRRRGLTIRVAPLEEEQVLARHAVPITSPARTVADCLRTLPGRDGLAIADAGLHGGLVTVGAVITVLRGQSGWPGVSIARQVLALADGRRESPLESWSAWAFAHVALPQPQWQVEIRDPEGRLIGRVDCWWQGGLAGEADGRAKYALAAAERGGGAGAVFQVLQVERLREQRLRGVGADVVRWSTSDVVTETAARGLARRIRAALDGVEDGARFAGRATPTECPEGTGRASA